VRADLRKAVVVKVAQEDSWDKEGGTKGAVLFFVLYIYKKQTGETV